MLGARYLATCLAMAMAAICSHPATANQSEPYVSLYELSERASHQSGGEWRTTNAECHSYLVTFCHSDYLLMSIHDLVRLHTCLVNLFQDATVQHTDLLEAAELEKRNELLANERLRQIYSGTRMYSQQSPLEECVRPLLAEPERNMLQSEVCADREYLDRFASVGRCLKKLKEEDNSALSDTYWALLDDAIRLYGRNCFYRLFVLLVEQAEALRDKNWAMKKMLKRWCFSCDTPDDTGVTCNVNVPKKLAKIYQAVLGKRRLSDVDLVDTHSMLMRLKWNEPNALKEFTRNLEDFVTAEAAKRPDEDASKILVELCQPVHDTSQPNSIARTIEAIVTIEDLSNVFFIDDGGLTYLLLHSNPVVVPAYMAAYACSYMAASDITPRPATSGISDGRRERGPRYSVNVKRVPNMDKWPYIEYLEFQSSG